MKETLDMGTYGNTKCAHDLVDILNNLQENKSNRLVGRIMNDYFSGVVDIMKTENYTETLLKMWVEKYRKRTNESNLDIGIKTRINNLIVARYRSEMKKVKKRTYISN